MSRKTMSSANGPAIAVQAPPASQVDGSRAVAQMLLDGAINASVVQKYLSHLDGADGLKNLIAVGREQVASVSRGDVSHLEAMLLFQTSALQAMFVELSRRALDADHREWQHHHLTLALKAQAQCRQAITALVELRMPKTLTFTKLANVSNGPQQVNINSGFADPPPRARAKETRSAPNELLEPEHEERLDAGKAGATGLADPRVEALDPVHRTPKR